MKYQLSRFVYGKMILDKKQNGVVQKVDSEKGFTVVGKTNDLTDGEINEYLPLVFEGQRANSKKSFEPIYNLTHELDNGKRIISYISESVVHETTRSTFSVRHCIILENFDLNTVNFNELTNQIHDKNNTVNRQFTVFEILEPFDFDTKNKSESILDWKMLEEYESLVLQILNALFLHEKIVVERPIESPNIRLLIIKAVYLLLPPSLQKRFSFHTNVFGDIADIQTRLKFRDKSSKPIKNHYRIDGSNPSFSESEITQYAFCIKNLLKEGSEFRQIASYCQRLPDVESRFDEITADLLANRLKHLIEVEKLLDNDSSVDIDNLTRFSLDYALKSKNPLAIISMDFPKETLNKIKKRWPVLSRILSTITD